MALEVRMPQLGLTMEEGTVVKWFKKEGDVVKKGDVILEINTDKLNSEITSEGDGIILEIKAKEGDDVPVKGLLAVIGEQYESIGKQSCEINNENNSESIEKDSLDEPKHHYVNSMLKRVKISPLAKKTALEMGIDYSDVEGTGSNGRIIQNDILKLVGKDDFTNKEMHNNSKHLSSIVSEIESTVNIMEGDEVVKMSGIRKTVAERMFKSYNEIPSVTQNVKVDVTKLVELKKHLNDLGENKFSLNDLIIKATAMALKSNRHILVSIYGDKIIKRAHINIGIAVALDDGLIVPVIKDADKMSIQEISKASSELSKKAREGRLNIDEYKNSTFTISNLGMYGVETFTPIINQPDAVILGVCAVESELDIDDNNKVFKKNVMRISLTYDHRLIDGAQAAKFEMELKRILENPLKILI